MKQIKQEIKKRLEETPYNKLIERECFSYKVDPEDIAIELEVDTATVYDLLQSEWYDETLEEIRMLRTEEKEKRENPYSYYGVSKSMFI